MFYQIIKAGKDEIGLVWSHAGSKPRVEYIYLPGKETMTGRIFRDFPEINKISRVICNGVDQLIVDLYEGQDRKVDLSVLNLSGLTEFAAKVLKQTQKIPRGKVATYSDLAAKVGNPRAARAVGTVMANNPFPLIIPCHRVIRADGRPGQFGGGSNMKKKLLEKEGVSLNMQGVVPPEYLHKSNTSQQAAKK